MNQSNYNEIMAELQKEYLASFDEKFRLLKKCFQDQDWNGLELEYHKLKGTGATYGVPEVTDLCRIMESICQKTGSLNNEQLNSSILLLSKIKDKYTKKTDFQLSDQPEFIKIKQS